MHKTLNDKSKYNIKSVKLALDILELCESEKGIVTIDNIVKQLRITCGYADKIINTLVRRNYIDIDKVRSCYTLGVMVLHLSNSRSNYSNIRYNTRLALKSLNKYCNETCQVGILKDYDVIYIDSVESTLPVRTIHKIGHSIPAYCTAAGKVLLAGELDMGELIKPPLDKLFKHTFNTITDERLLKKHLEDISAQGFALEDEEFDLGVRGVAAPILDCTRKVVGAVSVSGPVMRLSQDRMLNELVPVVKNAAREISLRVGYPS